MVALFFMPSTFQEFNKLELITNLLAKLDRWPRNRPKFPCSYNFIILSICSKDVIKYKPVKVINLFLSKVFLYLTHLWTEKRDVWLPSDHVKFLNHIYRWCFSGAYWWPVCNWSHRWLGASLLGHLWTITASLTSDLSLILSHPSDSKLLLINVVIYLKS